MHTTGLRWRGMLVELHACSNTLPTRLQCEVCGVNAPVMDFIPESEAW